jgi:hypothetical protein
MKIRLSSLFAALAAALLALLAPNAWGQNFGSVSPTVITNVDFPSIGTPDKITAFAVHSVNRILVFTWAYKTNGSLVGYKGTVWYGSMGTTSPYIWGPYTNKADLDAQCIIGIDKVLSAFMTNVDSTIDKSKGLYVQADYQAYSGTTDLDAFYWYNKHVYLAVSNGNYTLPDLSGLSSQLNSDIPLYLPGLQWARYEIGYVGDDYPFEVDDVLYDPSTDPVDSQGFLDLPTSYMSSSSLTNGAFWMKISAFANGKFWIWNGDGMQVPETPMKLDLSDTSSGALLTVNGGDSGLGFTVQWSPDMKHWTNGVPSFFYPLPESPAPQFLFPKDATHMFFRTATTNLPPY